MGKLMAMANIIMKKGLFIKANGKMINNMDMERSLGMTSPNTLENMLMEKNAVKVNLLGGRVRLMRGIFLIICFMEKVVY